MAMSSPGTLIQDLVIANRILDEVVKRLPHD